MEPLTAAICTRSIVMVGKVIGSGQNINLFLNSRPLQPTFQSKANFIDVLKSEFQKHLELLKEDREISGVFRYSLSINEHQV